MFRVRHFIDRARDILCFVLSSRVEREYVRKCKSRPLLSDEEFLDNFYSQSPFPVDIPLRIRKLFREQEGADRVIPTDCVWDMSDDFLMDELMYEISEEFRIEVRDHEIVSLDGTFDSIVKLVAQKVSSSQP